MTSFIFHRKNTSPTEYTFVRWIHLNHRKVDLSIGVRLPVLDIYEYDWKYYLNTLKQCERMYFRVNINRIEQSKSMIEDDFDNYAPETEEFERLLIIHSRLIQLLLLIKNTI